MSQKVSLYIERFYPFVCTLIICSALYFCRNYNMIRLLYSSIFDSTFLTTILTALSIVFGFLLTAFSTMYSSNSTSITLIKKARRFEEIIFYNKITVIWMFVSVVLTSLFLMTYNLEAQIPHYDYFVAFWVYSTIYSVILSYRFLNLFYILI